jgi:hypothetical protein
MYDNYRLREACSRSLPMLVIIFMLIILSKATHRRLSLQLNCPIMSLLQSSARSLPFFYDCATQNPVLLKHHQDS